MNIRPTQSSTYSLVRSGISVNFSLMIRAQEQLASGRSILRPSDNPVGTHRALSLNSRISGIGNRLRTIGFVSPAMESSTAALEEGVDVMARARELLIQGMNGTLTDNDRAAVAQEIELLRDQLMGVANQRFGGKSLFAGAATGEAAFETVMMGGRKTAVYTGDGTVQKVSVGDGVDLPVNLVGSSVFAQGAYSSTAYSGLTGIAGGTTSDSGTGYEHVELRHDATTGTLGAGLAFAAGNADTMLGDRTLTVDAAAGTVTLGGGAIVAIPAPGPEAADVVVTDEFGAELHLDFSGYTGADFSGTVTGEGSVSIDGTNFTAIDFAETDFELVHPDSGSRIHVDLTGAHRAGTELVSFQGTVNVFDTLQGIADDLRNMEGMSTSEVVERLELRLTELDRNEENLISSVSLLGGRLARLNDTTDQLADQAVQLEGLLSNVQDADLSAVVLDLTRAEQALELSQATGARLIQTSLLNFLQ